MVDAPGIFRSSDVRRAVARLENLQNGGMDFTVPDINKNSQIARQKLASVSDNAFADFAQETGKVNKVFTDDTRARLSLSPGSGNVFYKSSDAGILAPLANTNGIIFPYTPTISVSYSAAYTSNTVPHTNYSSVSYSGSTIENLTVTGTFTAETQDEGRYVLAVMHFLRTATKMYYGQDSNRGTPPPVLRFSAHGAHMFNSLPVVVANITLNMEDSTDYMNIQVTNSPQGSSTTTQVPMNNTFAVTLLPVYSRKRTLDFSLREYAKGNLIGKPGGNGGFI